MLHNYDELVKNFGEEKMPMRQVLEREKRFYEDMLNKMRKAHEIDMKNLRK